MLNMAFSSNGVAPARSLEGSREVTCRFIVPHDWSGDWVQINCEVLGRHKNYFTDKIELAGLRVAFGRSLFVGKCRGPRCRGRLGLRPSPP